jgi:hypothetical protein
MFFASNPPVCPLTTSAAGTSPSSLCPSLSPVPKPSSTLLRRFIPFSSRLAFVFVSCSPRPFASPHVTCLVHTRPSNSLFVYISLRVLALIAANNLKCQWSAAELNEGLSALTGDLERVVKMEERRRKLFLRGLRARERDSDWR